MDKYNLINSIIRPKNMHIRSSTDTKIKKKIMYYLFPKSYANDIKPLIIIFDFLVFGSRYFPISNPAGHDLTLT